MSDEKKPFAWVDACQDGSVGFEFINRFDSEEECVYIAADSCNGESEARFKVDRINAAVERERREAAVKALRDKAAFIEFDAKATWDRAIEAAAKCKDHLQYHARVARRQGMFDAASILNEEAAKIERGEQ